MDIASLIAELSKPEIYPCHVERLELRQTHISVICLTDDVVYKIRKSVKFSFLDFSTLAQRRFDCEREVELNQRLAPDVYLGIVPIVRRDGRVYVEGPGEVIDWAVKMNRLPDSATLEQRLQRGEVGPEMIGMLGRRLAAFHAAAASSAQIAEYGRYEAITHNVLENLEAVHGSGDAVIDAEQLARLTQLVRQRLESDRELIIRRMERRVPRDTHGDLRLDHVYFFPDRDPPADLCVIDCIEFNDAFRYADPVADIAFLIMDLKYHGHPELARRLTDEYFVAAGDEEGRQLLPLYVSYRAAVRAKVATLELAETEIPEAERKAASERARGLWILALSELEVPSRRSCLVLVGGLQGTGKTTLARGLSEAAGFTVIRTDVVRKELIEKSQLASPGRSNTAGIYAEERIDQTYEECLHRAVELLRLGRRVIVDATFAREVQRQKFLEAARCLGIPAYFLNCQADPEIVHRRLDARSGDASDADWQVYQAAVDKWEKAGSSTARVMTRVDCGGSAEAARDFAADVLKNAELL
jgi:aminoglycoside phosphotransferase family enzyme/predicted kinase